MGAHGLCRNPCLFFQTRIVYGSDIGIINLNLEPNVHTSPPPPLPARIFQGRPHGGGAGNTVNLLFLISKLLLLQKEHK